MLCYKKPLRPACRLLLRQKGFGERRGSEASHGFPSLLQVPGLPRCSQAREPEAFLPLRFLFTRDELSQKNKYRRADKYCMSLCFRTWKLNTFEPKTSLPLPCLPQPDVTPFLNYTALLKTFLIFPDLPPPPSGLVFSRFCPAELTLNS